MFYCSDQLDIAALKPNQRAVLHALAMSPTPSPYSQTFLSQINLSNGSMQPVIPWLRESMSMHRNSTA